MIFGDVVFLTDLLIKVVKAWFIGIRIGRDPASHRFVLGRDGEFPWPLAHGLEMISGEVIVNSARRVLGFAEQQRRDVAPVDDGIFG